MICLHVIFLAFIFLGVVWASWPYGFVSDINWGKFSVITAWTTLSDLFSFFSFWSSHCTQATPFVVVPQFLDVLVLFCFVFQSFFSFCFFIWEASINLSSEILLFPLCAVFPILQSARKLLHMLSPLPSTYALDYSYYLHSVNLMSVP